MVFEHDSSWDARDRFAWVAEHATTASAGALRALVGPGDGPALFNPLNWQRHDPVELPGLGLCQPELPACGTTATLPAAEKTASIALPATIETTFYTARISIRSPSLTSLKLKPSGREMLGGASNVLVAEKHSGQGDPGDFTDARPRVREASPHPATILRQSVSRKARWRLRWKPAARSTVAESCWVTRFYKQYPRIDFQTELDDLPDGTVVVAIFSLAETPKEIRRGIPFGFCAMTTGCRASLGGPLERLHAALLWQRCGLSPGLRPDRLRINGKTPVVYSL